jgi:plasmid stabilization system protein ParE
MAAAYRVILSRRSFNDPDEILEYVQQDSPQNAVNTIDRLWSAALSLSDFPARYPLYQVGSRTRAGTRVMVVAPYLVYYRISEPQKVVRVLTIRHGARRQPRKFD